MATYTSAIHALKDTVVSCSIMILLTGVLCTSLRVQDRTFYPSIVGSFPAAVLSRISAAISVLKNQRHLHYLYNA